jgi:glutamate synthase domain-containing protein 1
MPHAFYSRVFAEATGTKLGAPNSYGAGIIFTPKADAAVAAIKEIFEMQAKQRGLKVLGWRPIKTDNSSIGTTAKSTEPRMEQVFVENSKDLPFKDFDRELFRVRKMVELEAATHPDINGNMYVCSLSSQTVTYKGQLTPEQVFSYYKDLQVRTPCTLPVFFLYPVVMNPPPYLGRRRTARRTWRSCTPASPPTRSRRGSVRSPSA